MSTRAEEIDAIFKVTHDAAAEGNWSKIDQDIQELLETNDNYQTALTWAMATYWMRSYLPHHNDLVAHTRTLTTRDNPEEVEDLMSGLEAKPKKEDNYWRNMWQDFMAPGTRVPNNPRA